MHTDLPLEELRVRRSAVVEPADFDDFWARTLDEARRADDEAPRLAPVSHPLRTLVVDDVTFPGFAGEPVRAWFRRPARADGRLPVVVEHVGYGGGRGHVLDGLAWASAGFAHLLVDSRGQGAGWSRGDTPDPHGSGPAVPGVMTRGIEDPETYYYRRYLTDAVRAVDATRRLPGVDPDRLAVVGTSQAGAAALAVAGLRDDVAAVVAQVPFLCDVPRAITVTDESPYREVADYLARHRDREEQVLRTLSYVDGVVMARRATAPARFSVALMDAVTPPSTVFAAHNEYGGPARLRVWPYNGHEAGEADDLAESIAFVSDVLGSPA
ncbi:acetylxylan esterase [Aquipuribacter nitratireducens]|uniref:Acetylxylan esterase n=1 Tax=Aquipuribacter nitratireducens TaxID=650104 RepID=A0ABW0GU90_9MICO